DPLAPRPSVAGGKRAAVGARGNPGARDRGDRDQAVRCGAPGREALLARLHTRPHRVRVLGCDLTWYRHRVRTCPGVAYLEHDGDRRAEGRWTLGNRRCTDATLDERADRGGTRADAGVARRGR